MKTKTTAKKSKYYVGHIKVRPINKKKFDAMTPAQQRVAICKDVLLRLDAGKIEQRRGQYLSPLDSGIRDEYAPYMPIAQTDGKTFVNENKCAVCAKGALVLSWAANFNSVKVGNIYQADIINPIADIFPCEMRNAMESAFEAHRWSLRQIMSWIVEKKGDFHFDGFIYSDDGDMRSDSSVKSRPPKHLPK